MARTEIPSVRVCPRCGFSHLRASRARSTHERLHAWWTRTGWFRCETCGWRGRVRDVWNPDGAFPDLPPLKLGRDLDIEILQQRDEEAILELVLARKDEIRYALRVWLDDSRPAPTGWLRVTSVPRAMRLLDARVVHEISLDHDLGWCADCIRDGEHLKHSGQRHCPHTATGYDLVAWMAQTGTWPELPPAVHSGNLEGGAKMLGLIARHWHGDTLVEGAAEAAPAPPAAAEPLPQEPAPSAISTLTTCPHCHGPHVSRAHRHSNVERLRSFITRRHPVRCSACGWTQWVRDPILVRFNPTDAIPPATIDPATLESMEPESAPPADPAESHVVGH